MALTTPSTKIAILVARLRRGVVGESRRVCHVVPVASVDSVPESLTTLCGAELSSGETEFMNGIRGMPCSACLAVAAKRMPSEHSEVSLSEV